MKKYVAILLLSIHLISAPQFVELFKIPVLINHFKEHKQQDLTLNILSFLHMHYSHAHVKDTDYDKDMKLPFKTICASAISFLAIFYPTPLYSMHTLRYGNQKTGNTCYNNSTYSSSYYSSIWQPPKSC